MCLHKHSYTSNIYPHQNPHIWKSNDEHCALQHVSENVNYSSQVSQNSVVANSCQKEQKLHQRQQEAVS